MGMNFDAGPLVDIKMSVHQPVDLTPSQMGSGHTAPKNSSHSRILLGPPGERS